MINRILGEEELGLNGEGNTSSEIPLIASVRTGLAGIDGRIMLRVPTEYKDKSVGRVIEYLLQEPKMSEMPTAKSIEKELTSRGRVITVNGRQAGINDIAGIYAVQQSHNQPDGGQIKYNELEIIVSAVQQGGYASL